VFITAGSGVKQVRRGENFVFFSLFLMKVQRYTRFARYIS